MNAKRPFQRYHRLMLLTVLFLTIISVGCAQKQSEECPATVTALVAGTVGCAHMQSAELSENPEYSSLNELKNMSGRAAAAPTSHVPQPKNSVMAETKFALREPFEGIVLKNHRLRKYVYEQLGKEDDTPLYEEELEAYRGLLHYSFTISNGLELDFVRTYFDLDSFYSFSIEFTPDLHDWSLSQLEGLKDLQAPVRISGRNDTIPAEVLVFFTGTNTLIFDNIADVTGTLPPGSTFPETVRNVSLLSYRFDVPCTYENLFACMQDSNVEYLYIPRYHVDSEYAFLLDAVVGMKALVSLDVSRTRIRVANKECLSESSLQSLTNFILDGETDTSIFQMLPQLSEIVCDVAADADLSFVSKNDTLSVRLFFCPHEIESGSDYPELYPDCTPAVFPAFDDALGWREDGDENHFLAIYQRFMDEGRNIECFSIRYLTGESEREDDRRSRLMQNDRTFLRVTDGEQVQILLPERRDPELVDFGDYRSDYVSLSDINFDGINDITLDTGGFGNSQASYAFGWIYDNASRTYRISHSFRDIVNPFVDGEHQLIRSSWRISAHSHGFATYRYDEVNGGYRAERLLIEDDMTQSASELIPDLQVPENGTLWGYEETIYAEDGVTALEKNYYYVLDAPGYPTEYLDAYYNFHGPDSYWSYD